VLVDGLGEQAELVEAAQLAERHCGGRARHWVAHSSEELLAAKQRLASRRLERVLLAAIDTHGEALLTVLLISSLILLLLIVVLEAMVVLNSSLLVRLSWRLSGRLGAEGGQCAPDGPFLVRRRQGAEGAHLRRHLFRLLLVRAARAPLGRKVHLLLLARPHFGLLGAALSCGHTALGRHALARNCSPARQLATRHFRSRSATGRRWQTPSTLAKLFALFLPLPLSDLCLFSRFQLLASQAFKLSSTWRSSQAHSSRFCQARSCQARAFQARSSSSNSQCGVLIAPMGREARV